MILPFRAVRLARLTGKFEGVKRHGSSERASRGMRGPDRVGRGRCAGAGGTGRLGVVAEVHDVLKRAGKPLHVSEIIERVRKLHGLELERESIVSTLTKKVNRGTRFVRTDKNVFALKGGD